MGQLNSNYLLRMIRLLHIAWLRGNELGRTNQ
uniref:Uncharacterized protein n=1 Tax=Setaria italica TaxID=4555 RepID=K3Z1F0_SETIT